MLLQSGTLLAYGSDHSSSNSTSSNATNNSISATNAPTAKSSPQNQQQPAAPITTTAVGGQSSATEVARYLDVIQDTLKEGWTVHTAKDGRLYYCNHITSTASWLPPSENWGHHIEYPYGWEKAVDTKGRPYYINHLNKCTTYEAPEVYQRDDKPPEPRLVVLTRSAKMGFGFVAGSERPVIVRFVTEGGPSVNKLEPGDRILEVNHEDVQEAPRDHVIQLVRACEAQVSLLVCQPLMNGCAGRKSTLLSATKKAKLRSRPTRVRFAESVCVNGAPLFPPSAFSLGDLCVPPMANVLKVFLENGQTKSFKYDNATTVQGVVTSLREKLHLKAEEHFSLVLEHVKSLKRNKLTLLDPQETLARIAARPGAHKLRCLFRVSFVPMTAGQLAQRDLNALDYLYMQCCNDVTQERFAPELQPELALRLAALHIHQHSLANNISPAKLTVKTVEREFGLERFVPSSLIDGMKRKELRRLMAHFLKLNSQMTGSSKMLTQLQAKIHYLDIISSLPSYGAKCFSTNLRDGIERVLLVSPRFGLSQITGVRNSVPTTICNIELLTRITITREDDVTHSVSAYVSADKFVTFSMEDREAVEFALVLAGYYRLLTDKLLTVEREPEEYEDEDNSPPYVSQHTVVPSSWSYLATAQTRAHCMAFINAPPYQPADQLTLVPAATLLGGNVAADGAGSSAASSGMSSGSNCEGAAAGFCDSATAAANQCDRNMNTTLSSNRNHTASGSAGNNGGLCVVVPRHDGPAVDDFGFDMQSVIAMDILERTMGTGSAQQSPLMQRHHQQQNAAAASSLIETRNVEVMRRVAEMQRMVENSAKYLNEHGELVHEFETTTAQQAHAHPNHANHARQQHQQHPWKDHSLDGDSDSGSLGSSSKQSSNEDAGGAPAPGCLKHSDSLVLLAESISLDLTGITKGLTLIGTAAGGDQQAGSPSTNSTSNGGSSVQSTPQMQRRTQGLSQLLSDLHALSNDLSQSESDSESISTPNSSPIHRNQNNQQQQQQQQQQLQLQQQPSLHNIKPFRSSFGLHSPDTLIGLDTSKDTNLRDYLRQLKDASSDMDGSIADIDLAAQKLSELYGFEIGDDTFINGDPDVIDLTAIPPPQTPDELDGLGAMLSAAPSGFADTKSGGEFEKFLAQVTVAPPTQRVTPAKELTPEEIMSYIIPPPPGLADEQVAESAAETETVTAPSSRDKRCSDETAAAASVTAPNVEEDLYINGASIMRRSSITNNHQQRQPSPASVKRTVIEYATIERRGSFSCCSKSSEKKTAENASNNTNNPIIPQLPPRRCSHNSAPPPDRPPERPPKLSPPSPPSTTSSMSTTSSASSSASSLASRGNIAGTTAAPALAPSTFRLNGGGTGQYYSVEPPRLPPRANGPFQQQQPQQQQQLSNGSSAGDNNNRSPLTALPPRKPALPPIPLKPILRPVEHQQNGSPAASQNGSPQHHFAIGPNNRQQQLYGPISGHIVVGNIIAGGSAPSSPPVPAARLTLVSSNGANNGSPHHQQHSPLLMQQHHIHHHLHQQQHNQHPHPLQQQHFRSFSDSAPAEKLSLLTTTTSTCSPQMPRRIPPPTSPLAGRSPPSPLHSPHAPVAQRHNVGGIHSPLASPRNNGHHPLHLNHGTVAASTAGSSTTNFFGSPVRCVRVQSPSANSSSGTASPQHGNVIVNVPALLAKTDFAMAGLLVRLDQIAAQCSVAQTAGGGVAIDEQRFQAARADLTEQALNLVTASKLLVMTMSEPVNDTFPTHLTTCLTALRRVTELAQDMTRHTAAPLQTRNIVLKVHDVASMFRELAGVETGPAGAGPLALQAECLANVLATLLRSLRVFSP